jgi:putative PEP-CTERM system TPR-repeat lipoprotein
LVRGLVLGLVVAMFAACSQTPEAFVASAKDHLAKGDQKSAVIQLKNALQKNPDLAEARFLLGKALLGTGDLPAAEKELRKALELKYPREEVAPPLVRVLVAGGQYKTAIDEFGSDSAASPQGAAELQTALAQAYFATGDATRGNSALESAVAAQPDYPTAVLTAARVKAESGDLAGALASIDAALARNPKFPEGWLFKGELEMSQGRPDEGIAAFRKAIEFKPDFLAAHSALVTTLIAQGKAEDATAQFAAMKKVAPRHPQTLFLEAVLAYDRKDFVAASTAIQQQLRAAPDNLRGLLLSGAVNYQLKAYASSESDLLKVLKAVPGQLFARRVLIENYLKTGNAEKALDALKPVLGAADKNAAVAVLAGEVYSRVGQPAEGAKYFAKAMALNPQDSSARLGLAVSHLSTGQTETAFQELESAARDSPGTQADLILIRSALSRREYDKALASIDTLEKKQPNTPLASNLRGLALLGKRDVAGARKSFERAASLDPAFFPAAANLARLDLAAKKPEDAKKRFDAVLAKDPKHVPALLAIAEVRARSGGSPDEVAALIGKAIAASPTNELARLKLITHWLRANDVAKAVTAGQEALAALPDRPDILLALGRAHLAAGNPNQALEQYNKVVQLQPNSPVPLLRVAEAQTAAKDKEAALRTLRKALALKPDLVDAQRAIAVLELDAGRLPQAVAMAREVQGQRPKESVGYVLEGDLHVYKRSWNEAVAAYRRGLKQLGTVDLAIKVHAALVAGSNTTEADQFAASWIKDHPRELAFRSYLAQAAMTRNDYSAAAREYRALVELQPDSPVVLNNLAFAAGQLKDPKAIGYAERAYKLAPEYPAVLDTLGMLLVEAGDTERGIAMLQKAASLAPDMPSIRLNLAKAFIRAGRNDAAKKELETLAKLGEKFKSQGDVEQLMKGL